MRAPAQHSSHYAYDDAFDDGSFIDQELLAGERIGAPLRRSGARRFVRRVVVLAILGGGAWFGFNNAATVKAWSAQAWSLIGQLGTQTALVSPQPDRRLPAQAERVPALDPPVTVDIPPRVAPPLPPATPPGAPSPMTTGSITPAAPPADKAALEPLPPPVVDRADPLQVRAESVGLHPGLSRALLTRLSAADFRNADIAIKKALTEISDSAVLLWPRERNPQLALFKVHFVPGAPADCRRYVVTITKDRWATTAPPMEKCGQGHGPSRRPAIAHERGARVR